MFYAYIRRAMLWIACQQVFFTTAAQLVIPSKINEAIDTANSLTHTYSRFIKIAGSFPVGFQS